MNRILLMIIGALMLTMTPALSLAQSHGEKHSSSQGGTNVPTPSPSAYEHADEKAKLLRDTHDMGKHEGQEVQGEDNKGKDKDKDKDKSKVDDQGVAKEKDKSKEKSKDKSKNKSSDIEKNDQPEAGKEKRDKPQQGKHKQKAKDNGKGSKAESNVYELLDQTHKTKEEKIK